MGAAVSSLRAVHDPSQLPPTSEDQGARTKLGQEATGLKDSDEASVQPPSAHAAHVSVTGQSQLEAQHCGTKRQRRSDEQLGPPPKRHQSLGLAKLTASVIDQSHDSHGGTPLPRVSRASESIALPSRRAQPAIISETPGRPIGSASPRHGVQDRGHRGSQSPSADLLTAYDETAHDETAELFAGISNDLPHAAVQAAADLALGTDLLEGWKIAPEAPLSSLQRQQNRREINRAVMRLQSLTRSDAFGVRTDSDHDLFARLDAGTSKREPENNRVDFVQKARAARSKAWRRGVRSGRLGGKLVVTVSKKRHRSSEDVGGRSESDVYNTAQTGGASPLIAEGVEGRQRTLHGMWKTWPSMMKERWA